MSPQFDPALGHHYLNIYNSLRDRLSMSFKDMQRDVNEWANQFKIPYWQPLEIMARLSEETGELARELNHRYGPKKKKGSEDVQDLGDEIW